MNQSDPKNPITVWHVGGDDVRFRIPLLLSLRERGFTVGAVGSEAGNAFATHNIPYFRYSLAQGINPLAYIKSCKQLFTLFRQHQPDIVHSFDTKPAILAPLMAMKADVPGRVRTITGMGYVFSSQSPVAIALRPIYRHLQQKASAAAGRTIFYNSDDRNYFRQHGMVQTGKDELILGSGLDINHFLNNRPPAEKLAKLRQELDLEGKLVVTMIGRLDTSKGVREYLDAAAIVCQQLPNVKFLLIGPRGPLGRGAISDRELQENSDVVCYLGVRNDISSLLSLSDLFALPSYREGIPRVLLEAGAIGLPLVTTTAPGCREVVRDSWNGFLVPPRDATALATAILKLLQSKNDRVLMGARSRSYIAENFSLTKVADAYTNIYFHILAP